LGKRPRQKSRLNQQPREASLKELQKIWYGKLKDCGFDDIEHNGRLVNSSLNIFRNRFNETKYQTTLDYYQAATRLLHLHDWSLEKKPIIMREIWALHSEGHPTMKIVEILKTQGIPVYKCLAFETINRIKKLIIRNS